MSKIVIARLAGALCIAAVSAVSAASGEDSKAPAVVGAGPVNTTSSAPGVQILGTSDEAQVSLKVSWSSTNVPSPGSPSFKAPDGYPSWRQWSFVAQAPTSKSEKRHTLVDLNGLGDATSIGLDFNQFITGWHTGSEAEFARLCDDMKKKAPATATVECRASDFEAYDPGHLAAAQSAREGPDPGGWLFGGSAKLGAQQSTYYDRATFAQSSTNEHPWSVGLFAGWIPSAYEKAMVDVRFVRKKVFSDGDTSLRCLAGDGGVSTCVTGSFDPPTHAVNSSLALEGRWLTMNDKVGISATISRDLAAKTWTTVVPIYFVGDGNGGLTGGVQLSRTSATKDTAFALFVGVPFSVWAWK